MREDQDGSWERVTLNKSNFGTAITNFMPANIDGFKAKGSHTQSFENGKKYKINIFLELSMSKITNIEIPNFCNPWILILFKVF